MFHIDENQRIDVEFRRIANTLLLKKKLVVNEIKYRLTEIEFYYHSNIHPDPYTHKHSLEAGKWRFHNQGLDISLKGNEGYGGILIRGIETNGVKKTYINGPRRVIFEFTKYLNPVQKLNNIFGIEDAEPEEHEIFECFRHGLTEKKTTLKDNCAIDFLNAKYRFIVKPQKFDRKEFSGSEAIARSFHDSDRKNRFLGYNLKI
jgi:hypothetical protein